VSLTTNKVWLGYNYFNYAGQQLAMGGCDAVLIGNKQYGSGSYLVNTSGGTLRMYNNVLLNYAPLSPGNGNGVSVSGTGVESINNTIVTYYTPFQVRDATAPINLRNTILKSNYVIDIGANSAALIFANSCLFVGGNPQGSVVAPFINCIINQDPLVLGDGTLQDGSPCINAGMAAAIYNNRDGTRNTIGYTGGPYLNPANYTNNAPMVFLLAGPQTILKGAVSSISVSAAASAGH
jgi:hypothetical protein